jgi:hypothetical protein
VLGAAKVLSHQDHRRGRVALAEVGSDLLMLRVRAGEDLVGVWDAGDQAAHLALDLGHLGDQPR